jgi:hypothetical protein
VSIADRPYEDSYPPSLWDGSTPDPSITSLAPNTGVAGAGPFTVGVTGMRFTLTSVVEADQVAVPTTYVSATQLTAELDPQTAGSLSITVRNGGAGGEESNAVLFTVTPADEPELAADEPELADDTEGDAA